MAWPCLQASKPEYKSETQARVTAHFSLDLFYHLITRVYMCLYVINCLCVYFGLGLVDFGVRRVLWSFLTQGYFGHFVNKGKLVISW